ncbi:MAG: PASTA domain-containing protein, partial [Elusimicrobiota bacterium]|nr:PASTA domain-containing protein [Elusimicrobiota bacterium]
EKDYEVFDKNYEIDSIISQIPTANSIVREKIIIKVVTSKGDDEFGMPNIVKMDIRNAETTLKNHGLIIEEIQYAYSLNTEENKIIYQNPSANDIVTRGSVVNITISKGLPPNTIKLMPSVLGLKKDVVKILMENVGVEYTLDYIPVFDEKRKGIAIEQFPSGDSIIKDEQIVVIRIGE